MHFFFFRLYLPSIIFTSNVSGQPFLFTFLSPHPLPLERCNVNISIGLQWPVSAALIPTLLFEGSIVPDLLAWFACLWIMANEPEGWPSPSVQFSFSWVWSSKHTVCEITVIYLYAMDSVILSRTLHGLGCTVCIDTVMQSTPQPTIQQWLRYSIPL